MTSRRPFARTRSVGPARRLLVGAALTVAALAVPSGATVHASNPLDLGDRLRAACQRIPAAEVRLTTIVTRLEGAADVRGSLAWLEAKIATETAANHPRIVRDLQQRHDLLTAKLPLLRERADRIARAAELCATRMPRS